MSSARRPVRSGGRTRPQGFYEYLTQNVRTEEMRPTRSYHGDDFCVAEHYATGTAR